MQEVNAVLIPTTRGKFFMVDAEDEAKVLAFKWCAVHINHGWYAMNCHQGKRRYLHRFIMGDPQGMVIDHIDGVTENCCKSNLRVCTRQQNNLNRGARKRSQSGYKGVSRMSDGRWKASITLSYKSRGLGFFADPVEAAKAYDAAARELHGDFARLNFP